MSHGSADSLDSVGQFSLWMRCQWKQQSHEDLLGCVSEAALSRDWCLMLLEPEVHWGNPHPAGARASYSMAVGLQNGVSQQWMFPQMQAEVTRLLCPHMLHSDICHILLVRSESKGTFPYSMRPLLPYQTKVS